jgi:hypothetical protein
MCLAVIIRHILRIPIFLRGTMHPVVFSNTDIFLVRDAVVSSFQFRCIYLLSLKHGNPLLIFFPILRSRKNTLLFGRTYIKQAHDSGKLYCRVTAPPRLICDYISSWFQAFGRTEDEIRVHFTVADLDLFPSLAPSSTMRFPTFHFKT